MNLKDIGGTEYLVAMAVGIATVLLFMHFNLIPAGYMSGRLVARLALLLGAGAVFLFWPLIFKKKKDGQDDPS